MEYKFQHLFNCLLLLDCGNSFVLATHNKCEFPSKCVNNCEMLIHPNRFWQLVCVIKKAKTKSVIYLTEQFYGVRSISTERT